LRYVPPASPWDLPPLDTPELLALKSLSTGTANAYQQQLALKVIVQKFAATYDMSFRPGGSEGDRATIFAEGKRFVGTRIIEAIERTMKTQVTNAGSSPDPDRPEVAGRRNPKPERPRGKPSKPDA